MTEQNVPTAYYKENLYSGQQRSTNLDNNF